MARTTTAESGAPSARNPFGVRLDQAKDDFGLSLNAVEEHAGMSKGLLSKYCSGADGRDPEDMSAKWLLNIAAVVEVEPGWLLRGAGDKRIPGHKLPFPDGRLTTVRRWAAELGIDHAVVESVIDEASAPERRRRSIADWRKAIGLRNKQAKASQKVGCHANLGGAAARGDALAKGHVSHAPTHRRRGPGPDPAD